MTIGLLLVLASGVRMLGESVPARGWAGVVAIVGGLALVVFGAPPHAEMHRGGVMVVGVVGVLTALALAPFAVRGRRLVSRSS